MNTTAPAFSVAEVDFTDQRDALFSVRVPVFVDEQGVPPELEQDDLDVLSRHVLARDAAGQPIAAARLTPERRIGRMAVLPGWRGRGVGQAMLQALVGLAQAQGWSEVSLNAQASAIPFYASLGFVPYGPRFQDAGIEHLAMRRSLGGATAIEDLAGAVAISTALVRHGRRHLWLYSRELDPGLYDALPVLDALRRFAIAGGGPQVSVLLQETGSAQRAAGPLLALAQRLPSVFQFRHVEEPVDRAYPAAYLANDHGGYYFRPLGHRFDGEADLHGPGRARQLRDEFRRTWERARPLAEFRALGI